MGDTLPYYSCGWPAPADLLSRPASLESPFSNTCWPSLPASWSLHREQSCKDCRLPWGTFCCHWRPYFPTEVSTLLFNLLVSYAEISLLVHTLLSPHSILRVSKRRVRGEDQLPQQPLLPWKAAHFLLKDMLTSLVIIYLKKALEL